jgi:polyketide cyclase/dehydrase/lipid transport protein
MDGRRLCLQQMARSRLLPSIAAAVLALAAQSAAPASIVVDVQRDGDSIVINAQARLDADLRSAWQVLTDYERYAEFIPGVRSSQVLARRGSTVTVGQYDDAVLLLLPVPVRITYEIAEQPPRRLESRAVAGGLPPLHSAYELSAVPSGVRLEYSGRLAPVSPLFGSVEQWAIQRSVVRQFQALADEIERTGAATAATAHRAN